MKHTLQRTAVIAAFAAAAATSAAAPTASQSVLFDFNNAPLHTSLPIDLTVGGITAHFNATGQGFSIQDTSAPVVPVGFTGRFIYPNSIYPADLLIGFDQTLTDFSILYSPQELGCDDSATMRVTATMNGVFVGTSTKVAGNPGTWPVDTLSCSFPQGFNAVVVHYDHKPPTCTDWGPIFLADDMRVTAMSLPPLPVVGAVTPDHGSNGSGAAVTISGANFGGATSVKFGGVPIASFVVQNAATITANLPATPLAGWVVVAVTTPGGTGSLALAYDYFDPPLDVGSACSTPSLTWSGAPCLGQDYTLTTSGLGGMKQLLLVDWSDLNPGKTLTFPVSKSCPSTQCAVYVQVDHVLSLGVNPSYTFALPNSLNLAGVHLRTQAFLRGCPNITTQALDATIGL